MIKYIHLDTIESTNDYAKQHPEIFDPNAITCITAEEQTKGRGRFNRHWVSPKGENIYATFYFALPIATPQIGSLSQIAALSVVKTLQELGFFLEIKWPNDVRIEGKKLAGVLTETRFHKEVIEIFLGIGINVNLEKAAVEKIDQPATSLLLISHKTWDKEDLLRQLSTQLEKDLKVFKKEGFTPFKNDFVTKLCMKEGIIHCFDGEKTWKGHFDSITDEGQLTLRLENGQTHTITSGDVISS